MNYSFIIIYIKVYEKLIYCDARMILAKFLLKNFFCYYNAFKNIANFISAVFLRKFYLFKNQKLYFLQKDLTNQN